MLCNQPLSDRVQKMFVSELILISNLRMHANRQMMWQIEPEAIPLSWTLVQVQTCLTELQKVTANILNPPVSVPVNAFSLQKPLSSSYHVFLCIFWRYEPNRPY